MRKNVLLIQEEIKEKQLKKFYSVYVLNFFNVLDKEFLYLYEKEQEIESFLSFFEIEKPIETINDFSFMQKNNNEFLKKMSLHKNFMTNFMQIYKKCEEEKKIISKNYFIDKAFKKIIFLFYVKRKFPDLLIYYKKLKNITFDNMYNIIIFRENKEIIERHLLGCKCNDSSMLKNNINLKTNYIKYISIFSSLFINFKKNTFLASKKNLLFDVFFNASLCFNDVKDAYGLLPLYFLIDIFGIKIEKECCHYSLLYEKLLDNEYKFIEEEYFLKKVVENCQSSHYDSTYYSYIKDSSFSIKEKLPYVFMFEKENKEDAIIDLLFENKKNFINYMSNYYIFNGIYSIKKKRKIKNNHFYTKQKDYLETLKDIHEHIKREEITTNMVKRDISLTFYNFVEEKYIKNISFLTDIHINENNLTFYFYDDTQKIFLTKYTVEKIASYINYLYIFMSMKEETENKTQEDKCVFTPLENKIRLFMKNIEDSKKLFYDINLILDDEKYKNLFKKILSGKNRDENFFKTITTEEYDLLDGVICFSLEENNNTISSTSQLETEQEEQIFFYNKNEKFTNLLKNINQEENKVKIQNICKFFLKTF